MYDVFFISYGEPHADEHWKTLLDNLPVARRISDVDGIQAAHRACAAKSRTSHFWVVDADNEILNYDVFGFEIPEWDRDYVHLWFARNPLNGLEYGWGGLKLFPKTVFSDDTPKLDMTTSFPLKIKSEVASITRFNTGPFETWRSAFRECAKLVQSGTPEAKEWLETWMGIAEGPYRDECLRGSLEGWAYGKLHARMPEALQMINDYGWLSERFNGRSRAGS